jgi:hypothetical protein
MALEDPRYTLQITPMELSNPVHAWRVLVSVPFRRGIFRSSRRVKL